MLQRLRAARANEDGFTLIELLIVIVILGVLSGIVVFAVGAFNNDGVVAACKSDMKNVEVASEAYYAKNNSTYATNIAALVSAGYLKEAPSTSKYTITYTPGSGTTQATVTGTINGGASCTATATPTST
jgi:general secretion pathway protein G